MKQIFKRLPYELEVEILEYDPTKRIRFEAVLNDLKLVREIERKVDHVVYYCLQYGIVLHRRLRSLVRTYRKRQLLMAFFILYKPNKNMRQKLKKATKRYIVSRMCIAHEHMRYLNNLSNEHYIDFMLNGGGQSYLA